MSEAWLKPAQLAERYSLSRSAVYRGLREGRIPGTRVLGAWRTQPAALREWEANLSRVPAPSRNQSSDFREDVARLRRERPQSG